MTKTVSSSTQLYMTPALFLLRVNPDIVAQLCSDDPDNPVLVSSLVTDANLNAALLDACGTLESATLMGGRYEVKDLLKLVYNFVGDTPTTTLRNPMTMGGGLLFRIITSLAWFFLWTRRPNKGLPPPPDFEWAKEMLDQLSQGSAILGFIEVEAAGLPEFHQMDPDEIEREDLATTLASRFYGTRGNRERFPRV